MHVGEEIQQVVFECEQQTGYEGRAPGRGEELRNDLGSPARGGLAASQSGQGLVSVLDPPLVWT